MSDWLAIELRHDLLSGVRRFRGSPLVDPRVPHRYVAAVRARRILFAWRRTELNIARRRGDRVASGCQDFTLFALGKVTAGNAGNER
ncbi:hypothetical protein GCM10022276_25520 [Sphingomonas limnosediminicola]|uniref:Uncharacterized protein n=1 Tax=Sphingomonas limnosediminicola TaxID=940133 RepID=A0ABP7LTP0_9SPHN